ncbi:MAG: dUTP diphosphatase [Pseudomonadaceae bacterium]|nr:dUTP diphosphatase [Pseudomonadaceae bacterium]
MAQADAALRARVATMASMQIQHNEHVHPDWRTQGYPYYRAIWVECAELLDHYGWKWWKHQECDLDQARLEIVDIWHFALSDLLRSGTSVDVIADELATSGSRLPFADAVEQIASSTLANQGVTMSHFRDLMASLPMGEVELFDLYVGKNVLNNFRQSNGYKDGSYRKLWAGREDNDHLIEALSELECAPEEVPDHLFAELTRRYEANG